MKTSSELHVSSVVAGVVGAIMSAVAVLFWPAGVVWIGITRDVVLSCAITTLLAAIWRQTATIHHVLLEAATSAARQPSTTRS